MPSPITSLTEHIPARRLHGAAVLLCSIALSACSGTSFQRQAGAPAPLKYADREITVEEAFERIPETDLLAVDDEMRAFVETYTAKVNNKRTRLWALHSAVKGPAVLDLQYDPFADGDARSAFHRGTANCLSYAHMFVAMARLAGLDAHYQHIEVRPRWERIGERVALSQHVNVMVKMPGGEGVSLDIDPIRSAEIAGAALLSDGEGAALYYSNLAMAALSEDDPVLAWMYLVRALDHAPRLSQLWVNLGAVYRQVGQMDEAEDAYYVALSANPRDRSAMNNLAVLYGMTGRPDDEAYWLNRLYSHRQKNPYYHSHLGDVAAQDDDWDAAFKHYRRAVQLQPGDSRLVYGLAVIQQRRGKLNAAARLINLAIERATYRQDVEGYRMQLRALEEQQRSASL